MTPPATIAAPPTTRWPASSAVPLIPQTWPQGICGWHPPSRSLNSWQGSHSLTTCPHCRSISTPLLHSHCWPSPPWPPAEPHHTNLTLYPHLISPVVRGSSPPSANHQQKQPELCLGMYCFSFPDRFSFCWAAFPLAFWPLCFLSSSHYASPSSGDTYSDRQLTTNFELRVEIFCVLTCFHVRIPKQCLSVPREKKSQ